VLEFSISHAQQSPPLGTQLLHLWPAYLAYLTSFVTIGIIWMNHHHAVSLLGRTDRTFMFINILLLLIVAYMPFPTRLVGDYLRHGKGEGAAALDYAATFVLMSIVFNAWWRYASGGRRLIAAGVPDSTVRAISRAFNPGVFMYGAVFVIA